jgi:hypothetical protein
MQRDPRVVISFEGTGDNGIGMRDYLVIHGTARITQAAHRSCCTGSRRPMSARARPSRR